MTYWAEHKTVSLAVDDVDIDSGSSTHEFIPGKPIDLIRVGVVVTTDVANSSGTVDIDVVKRPTAGSSTDESTESTLRVTGTDTVSAGEGVYRDIVRPQAQTTLSDGSIFEQAPEGPVEVDLGESLLFSVSNAADSGAVAFFFEYIEHPFVGGSEGSTNSRISNMTEDTT